ncbi:tyrosine-protein phosphatase [Branchiibius sp. NY16-3462-2]|uniref:tyrosine-protein phosphatase n=1 Tax=Branchiibius sp. NY16-3462-2 TaxID=1807500 RepID=UPI00079525B6|nr:tyrosine-protein phosphatase [Branchiibius sp. NY16-3462-2]KYH43343.1 hypothetical protein AZH51_12735 [Branchiibius sp. NY16-3462-2]
MAQSAPGAPIDLPTLANLRDLGGWTAADGAVVASGRLYRSTKLAGIDEADTEQLVDRQVQTVIDLRTKLERDAEPDPAVPGATNVFLDVLEGSEMAASADLRELLKHPREVTTALSDGKAVEFMSVAYREIVVLPSALTAYRSFFDVIEQAVEPVLFHCTTGKDRTGWGAALIFTVLGVPREQIVQEYLLTNEQLLPRFKKSFEAFELAGGDPDVLRPVLGVDRAYLQNSFDTVDKEFGSMDRYLADGLGMNPERQQALRANYLS